MSFDGRSVPTAASVPIITTDTAAYIDVIQHVHRPSSDCVETTCSVPYVTYGTASYLGTKLQQLLELTASQRM